MKAETEARWYCTKCSREVPVHQARWRESPTGYRMLTEAHFDLDEKVWHVAVAVPITAFLQELA